MYVTVYADGPTRVLQFSDEPTLANSGYDQSIVDLAARTKQVQEPEILLSHTLQGQEPGQEPG